MKNEKINFCQPDEKHFCIECCLGTQCEAISPIGDDKFGCALHPDYKYKYEGLKRREICDNFICWDGLSEEDKTKLLETISKYERKKYSMTQALQDAGISRKAN